MVIFLNGLNDITNGATSKALYGERVQLPDGSPWTPMYHAHDYGQRATDYLINMDAARNISKSSGAEMLVVLQPSLAEREHKTRIEKRLLKGSLISHPSVREINESYASIRSGLYKRSQNDGFHYLDCSKIFDSEPVKCYFSGRINYL